MWYSVSLLFAAVSPERQDGEGLWEERIVLVEAAVRAADNGIIRGE